MVNIRQPKERLSIRFPGKIITEILWNEPDEVESNELIGKLVTWQSVIDSGRRL